MSVEIQNRAAVTLDVPEPRILTLRVHQKTWEPTASSGSCLLILPGRRSRSGFPEPT